MRGAFVAAAFRPADFSVTKDETRPPKVGRYRVKISIREVLLMKAAEVFNACHARYRGLHEWLDDSLGQVRALDLDSPSCGYQWRPERSRACEYVADFERIGRRALKRPAWKGRLKLFEIYFVGGIEYRRAITLVGVAEGTFDYWMAEVKKVAGREFSRAGLYPPSHYFQSTHAHQAQKSNS